jgi:hypothetical protein
VAALRQGGGDGLIVAVLGDLDMEEARGLARIRHGGMTGVAVLLDIAGWDAPGAAQDKAQDQARDGAQDGPAGVLAGAGWRIVRLGAGTSIASVWPAAGVRGGVALSVPGGVR